MKAYCIAFAGNRFVHLDPGIQHNGDAIRATAYSMGFFPKGGKPLDQERFEQHFRSQGGIAICSDGTAFFPHSMKSQKIDIPKAHENRVQAFKKDRRNRQKRRNKDSGGLRKIELVLVEAVA